MRQINREILALAIPAIVSNITTPLLGLVDTAITGHLGSAAYIGAIAVGGSMFSMTYWLFNFLRMGTSGLTAQAYGKGAHTHQALWRAFAVGIAASLALIALSPILGPLLLRFMEADAATTALAELYFQIVIFGAPAVLCTYALSGWFLGMQDSKAPMWMALATNVSNIAISLALVYGCGMKIAGVAIGTMSAQWIGLILGLALAHRAYGLRISLSTIMQQFREGGSLGRFFKVNTDIFLRTLCLVAVTVWFTRAGASMGAAILAANALLMQLFILFSYFMDGFAFAGEAMAGKYWGMSNGPMLRTTVRGIMAWGAVLAVAFTLLYAFAGTWAVSVLTDDAAVVEAAKHYLPWAIAVPAAGVMAFVWDGIFIGATLTRQMLTSMAIATATFFIIYLLCGDAMANHGLWLAFVSYLAMRGVIQTIQWKCHF